MWSQFPPNLSCLQNNPPENNVEPVPAKWTAGYLRFGGNWDYIIFRRIILGSISFRLKIFFLKFGGNWDYIIFWQIVLGSICFRLKNFF